MAETIFSKESHLKFQELFLKSEERRLKRIRTLRFLFAGLAIVIFYFSYNFYKFAHHPLIGGIAARHNPDGTVDYTMIGFIRPFEPPNKRVFYEWVVRLPESARVYGIDDDSDIILSGAISATIRGRKNELLSTSLAFDDLKPMEPIKRDLLSDLPPDQTTFNLRLRGKDEYDMFSNLSKSLDRDCDMIASPFDRLEHYVHKKDEKYPLYCKDDRYVLWKDAQKSSAQATIECRNSNDMNKFSFCDFNYSFGGLQVSGDYPSSRLAESGLFFDRLGIFLKAITVVDRKYSEKPFVYD